MAFWRKKQQPVQASRAIVLGGGGSKGAYQVGVWQALEELKIPFRVVTGTSVGALNGALMAQGDFQGAYDLWWDMENAKVLRDIPNVEDHPDDMTVVYRAYIREMIKNGGVDTSPLEDQVRALLDEEKLRSSGIDFGIVTVDMTSHKPVELFLDDMAPGTVGDYMMASAACFPALKPKTIGKNKFIDGGYHDNIPVAMALLEKDAARLGDAVEVEVRGRRIPAEIVPLPFYQRAK